MNPVYIEHAKMRSIIVSIVLFLASSANAKSLGNYEGDTITFNLPRLHRIIGDKTPIIVNGIDTPKIKGGLGRKGK